MPNDLSPKRLTAFKDIRPGQPLNTVRLDIEFDQIYSALEAVEEFLLKSHDGDGFLRYKQITEQHLTPSTFQSIKNDLGQTAQEAKDAINAHTAASQNLVGQSRSLREEARDAAREAARHAGQALAAQNQANQAKTAASDDRATTNVLAQQASIVATSAETASQSARLSEDMAFRWAEKMDGPVFLPEGADPVDDGFYSSKYWSLQAKAGYDDIQDWYDQIEIWYNEIANTYYPELNDLYADWRGQYYGALPGNPTTDPNGDPPTEGDLYFNTTTGSMRVYDGTNWVSFAGESTFLGLTDTPDDYTGQANRLVAVNEAEDGLVYVDIGGGGSVIDALDDRYVNTDGDRMTGPLEIISDVPQLSISTTNPGDFARIEFYNQNFGQLQGAVYTSPAGVTLAAREPNAGNIGSIQILHDSGIIFDPILQGVASTARSDYSILTRLMGDNRYITPGDELDWNDLVNVPATFPPSPHTHTESQITDLDKYTQAEIDAQQAIQDTGISTNTADILALQNNLANNYYTITEVDADQSAQDLAIQQNATDIDALETQAGTFITDAPNDGNQYARQNEGWAEVDIPEVGVGDYLPISAEIGNLFYQRKGQAGLFIRVDDDSGDEFWVQSNGGGAPIDTTQFVQVAGDTMTGPLIAEGGIIVDGESDLIVNTGSNVDISGSTTTRGYTALNNAHIFNAASYVLGGVDNPYIFLDSVGTNDGAVSFRRNGTQQALLYSPGASQTMRMGAASNTHFCVVYQNVSGHGRAIYASLPYASSNGYACKSGTAGGFQSNRFNFAWGGTYINGWIDGTFIGGIQMVSDRRLKNLADAVPVSLTSSLERLKQVNPVWWRMKDIEVFKDDGVSRFGVIADELQQIFPEAVIGTPGEMLPKTKTIADDVVGYEEDGTPIHDPTIEIGAEVPDPDAPDRIKPMSVDYNQLTVHLIEAVKELTARLEALEAV